MVIIHLLKFQLLQAHQLLCKKRWECWPLMTVILLLLLTTHWWGHCFLLHFRRCRVVCGNFHVVATPLWWKILQLLAHRLAPLYMAAQHRDVIARAIATTILGPLVCLDVSLAPKMCSFLLQSSSFALNPEGHVDVMIGMSNSTSENTSKTSDYIPKASQKLFMICGPGNSKAHRTE